MREMPPAIQRTNRTLTLMKDFLIACGTQTNEETHRHFTLFSQRLINSMADANMLITSPVGYFVKGILWKPNVLPLFNLGW